MIKIRHTALIAGALIATPVLAQTAPATPETPAAPSAPASAVTDADVKLFAKAAIAADKVQKDANIPAADKPKHLAEAVTAAGLPPERFNEIATAAQSDTALQAKVQAAITAEQTAPTQ
jgi:hypothetical protein